MLLRFMQLYRTGYFLFCPGTQQITIGTTTGELKVGALDRDFLKKEVFNFYVSENPFDLVLALKLFTYYLILFYIQ